jgi:hypothetical protein
MTDGSVGGIARLPSHCEEPSDATPPATARNRQNIPSTHAK